jgi:hypothetical protein
MTYTFKLARRLAVLRIAGAGALLALGLGCDAEPLDPGGSDPSAETVDILPDSLTVETDQLVRFAAYARRAVGDSTTLAAVDWAASGGSITSTGLFSAAAPGTYKIYGRRRHGSRVPADSSVVTVVPPPASLVQVVVTPDTATVAIGVTRAFSAIGKLSDSSTAPLGVSWTATGGTVDPSGVYTAGTVAGVYRVIATNTAGTLADTAVVTIPAPPAAPPPPPPPPPPAPITSVVITPSSATLAAGASQQFAAYGRDADGDSLAVAVQYVATGGTVTSAGLYAAGTTAGTYRVIAKQSGGTLADTAIVTVPPPVATSGLHVSPNGSGTACTNAQPCSFATAIGSSSPARPGDTVWVHAGRYAGEFTATKAGTASAPIIYRAAGRAIIDGPLFLQGADTWWWGLEHTFSLASGNQRDAIYGLAARLKLINCYIHDAWGNAVGAQATAPDFELVGCVAVHNGLKGSGSHVPDVAHGFYTNSGPTGTITFRDFILTQTQGYGLHFYTQGNSLRNITVQGGIVYANGQQDGCNATIGAGIPVVNLVLEDNAFWEGVKGNGCVWLGREASPDNSPMTVRNNVVFGGDPALRLYDWASGSLAGNTIVQGRGALLERVGMSALTWTGNSWYGPGSFSKPGSTDAYTVGVPANRVMVRPNAYEPGRANVAVYNWSRSSSVTVTVPGLGAYEVRTPEAFMGAPVATGTGPSVTLPLNGAVFGAFVVAPAGALPR